MTEQQPYTVIGAHQGFELRHYPEHMVIEVEEPGTFAEAGNRGFGPLVRYISGNNGARQNIAMTAPVVQTPLGDQRYTVAFVLPEGMDAASLPIPSDARVQPRTVAPRTVAARRFSGLANTAHFESAARELLASVALAGLTVDGEPYFARYDPPWRPGFLRRNEALVVVSGA
jgi:hypothetical protein